MENTAKLNTARNVLKSWAKASGVETVHVDGADLGVMTSIGPVGIKVADEGTGDFCFISPSDIVNKSNRHNVESFQKLLGSLDLKYKKFWRGDVSELDRRTYNGRELEDGTSETDLTLMRHLEFRTAPDLSHADIEEYGYCVNIAANWFYRHNRVRLDRMCVSVEDLKQYGMVWMTNFLHRYRRDTQKATASLLMNYLKQRYAEFHRVSSRSDLNVQPKLGAIQAGLYEGMGGAYVYGNDEDPMGPEFVWATAPDVERFQELAEREEEEDDDTLSYKTRSRYAQQRLREAMGKMNKEKLKELLAQASQNSFIAEDAQELAQKLLEKLELGSAEEEA